MNSPDQTPSATAGQAAAPKRPAARFRLVRHFFLTSIAAFLLFAVALAYFQILERDFFRQSQQEERAFFAQLQDKFVLRHDPAAAAYLLRVLEASNVNLARLFQNATWEHEFAPFLTRAQRIPVDQCRAMADTKDAAGKVVPTHEKNRCFAEIGAKIRALPEFQVLDAKVFATMSKSTVAKIKIYDLRGITVYSSEHAQVGEDRLGDVAWESAITGKPTSELSSRDQFNTFEGAVANREVVASYLPVRDPRTGNIAGAFELYSDATQFVTQIRSTSVEIRGLIAANEAQLGQAAAASRSKVEANAAALLAAMFAALALLYVVLYLIVRNAQRAIDRHEAERSRADAELARQTDLYSMLSHTNKAIVHMHGQEDLFATVCRVAVEHGRFRFAWIALRGRPEPRIEVAARYGEDAGYIDRLQVMSIASDAKGRGPTGKALRSNEHAISNDFLADPATSPWHESARNAGVRASGAFPIREGGELIGTLNVYAGEPGFFTASLLATLDEIATDISFALDNFAREFAHRQTVEELRVSEARYRRIYESLQDVYVETKLDGTILEISAKSELLFKSQYRREDLIGKNAGDLYADLRRRQAVLQALERDGKVTDFEVEFRNRDGSLVPCSISATRSVDANGAPTGIVAMLRDISERKKAERDLAEANVQFKAMVEQSIAGILIIQDRKLAYVNPRFGEIHGYASSQELIGTDPLSLIVEKDRSAASDVIRRLLHGEEDRVSYALTGLRKDGSVVELGISSARASYHGRPAIIAMMQDISEKKRAEEEIQRYVEQLKNAFMSTVEVATTIGEMRDPYTAGHERRVAEIAVAIGAELGFDERRLEGLRVAGYLHDLGKITIPAEILSKPGKLSAIEYILVQGHAQSSYDVLASVSFPWPVAQMALQHHERMDGSGYPQGLKGEAIMMEARILAVADVVEAMSSHRPYRPGLGIDKALAEIERGRGTAYDPQVADACLRLFREKGHAIPA